MGVLNKRVRRKVFDAAEALGAVLFIDEVDALAGSRGTSSSSSGGDPGSGGGGSSDMHEATRRLLSVILQRVDGLEGPSRATLVCATNRRQDLDPALLSRFDLTLTFGLPNAKVQQAFVLMVL
jgi:SpoVK/Ycf46/Vps4 family AAA+-type ATPase